MIRKGQAAFNKLYAENPKIADMIRGSQFDPFYRDERLRVFDLKVAELLSQQQKEVEK